MVRIRKALGNRWVITALIVLAFILLAIFMTRPVITEGNRNAISDPYDPSFHAWTISWDIHALFTNPFNLFNANIFFPNADTLAYSEHEITNAVIAIPFMAATDNPIQTANLMIIFNFCLSAVGAYLLVHHLTRNRPAAFASGIAFAFAPYMFSHVTQLGIGSAGWIPLTILFLHLYSEDRKPRYAFLFALFFVLQFLANTYIGLFLSVGIVIFFAVRLLYNRKTFTLKWMAWVVAALILAGLVLIPFALPYIKVHNENPELVRTIEEVDSHSADVQDFLVAPSFNFIWGHATSALRKITFDRAGPNHRSLFPGLIILLLGLYGAYYLFRKGKGEERFCFWFYSVLLVLSAVFCLGTSLYVFGHRFNLPMPYDVLYRVIPGFKALRVPTIFAMLTTLSFAVLAGFGVRGIVEYVRSKKGRNLARAAFAVILVLLFLDVVTSPLPMAPVPPKNEFPPVYTWLKEQKGQAPTVELPLPRPLDEWRWVDLESRRTYYSTLHWKKILNGFSSFSPASYIKARNLYVDFPSDEFMNFLEKEGVEFVIFHASEEPETAPKLEEWDATHADLELIRTFGSDQVYRLD